MHGVHFHAFCGVIIIAWWLLLVVSSSLWILDKTCPIQSHPFLIKVGKQLCLLTCNFWLPWQKNEAIQFVWLRRKFYKYWKKKWGLHLAPNRKIWTQRKNILHLWFIGWAETTCTFKNKSVSYMSRWASIIWILEVEDLWTNYHSVSQQLADFLDSCDI